MPVFHVWTMLLEGVPIFFFPPHHHHHHPGVFVPQESGRSESSLPASTSPLQLAKRLMGRVGRRHRVGRSGAEESFARVSFPEEEGEGVIEIYLPSLTWGPRRTCRSSNWICRRTRNAGFTPEQDGEGFKGTSLLGAKRWEKLVSVRPEAH